MASWVAVRSMTGCVLYVRIVRGMALGGRIAFHQQHT